MSEQKAYWRLKMDKYCNIGERKIMFATVQTSYHDQFSLRVLCVAHYRPVITAEKKVMQGNSV